MTQLSDTRDALVDALRKSAQDRIAANGVSRDTLDSISQDLVALAARQELWSSEDFPPPDQDEKQARYLIAEDPNQTYALYLNVMRPGKRIPPHDHTTWATVAAVEGVELNTVWSRTDDRSVAGRAEITPEREVRIEPGSAIALLPEDIHSVFIPGEAIIRHLHFYGRALETLSGRTMYDPEEGTCRIMDIGVKTVSAGA